MSWGIGQVDFERGKWSARLPRSIGRKRIGRFDTEAEARHALTVYYGNAAEDEANSRPKVAGT